MLGIWFKIFFRNSQKNWLNILVNVLGLTLGFAGLLIVLLFLNDEQSYNTNNPHKDEVFRVIHKMSEKTFWGSGNHLEAAKYKDDIPEIPAYYLSSGRYSDALVKVNGKDQFSKSILKGAPNFFDFFPFDIIEGSANRFKDARNHVAISEKQANAFFGMTSAIGKTIDYADRTFVVTTVYKIVGKHYYMPNIIIQYKKQPDRPGWDNFGASLFVKKTKEATVKVIEKKALAIWYQNYVLPSSEKRGITPAKFIEKEGVVPLLEPIKDIRLKTLANSAGPEGKGNYQLILIMLSLSVLLIIISCVNFINLSIASAAQRGKEVGVKKTLGLSKVSLAKQYALETVLQGGVAFVFSVLLVELILPSFNSFMNKDISILEIDLLVKMAFLAIVVSVVIGSIPAIYLSNFKSIEVLKGNVSKSKKGVFSRNLMLGIQFLISGFFLVGSIIIHQQVNYMMDKELGFKGDQVVVVNMHDSNNQYKKYLLAQKELIRHPNIEAVTSSSFVIGVADTQNSTNLKYKNLKVQSSINAIDFNYLDAMGIQILKGRNFKEEFASDTISKVLINETLAKAFNIFEDPIGKKIKLGWLPGDDKNAQVVGMVKDYHTLGLDREIPPTFFLHWNTLNWIKNNFGTMQFKIKSNNVDETLLYIESYWKENVEQGYPFSAEFLNKRFARTYAKYQKQKTLFLILTTVVIIISLLGLFGLATLTIQQRLKEVAIRKTLGASVKEIMFQLIKSFLKITIIASIILIPIAYYFMQNWLENFVYRIDMPVLPFILAPIVLIILVFAVVGLKAYNATKIDLIKHLKFE